MIDDAPKITWLLPHGDEQRYWCNYPDPSRAGHGDEKTGYVRIDVVATILSKNFRMREALQKIESAPAWGYPDKWETTPAEVRQLARTALGDTGDISNDQLH